MERLAELCELTRSAPLVAQSLGLARHEDFATYLIHVNETLSVSTPHCLVASVVYRCDLRSQYKNLPLCHKKPYNPWVLPVQHQGPALMDGAVDTPAAAGSRDPAPGQAEGCGSEHLRQMLGFHAWSHLKTAAGPQDFFSLTPDQALPVQSDMLMVPFSGAVTGGSQEQSKLPLSLCDGPKGVEVHMEFAEDAGVPDSPPPSLELALTLPGAEHVPLSSPSSGSKPPPSRPVLFRIVSGAPGQKKLARTDQSLEIGGDHMAVERCEVHELDYPRRQVSVYISHGACESQLLQRPASFESCLAWSVLQTKAAFRNVRISSAAQGALDEVLKARATGDSSDNEQQGRFQLSVHFHSEHYQSRLSGLQDLQALGLVQEWGGGDGSSEWALSSKGMDDLCQVAVLHQPVSLLSQPTSRSEAKPLEQLTVLELVMRLQAAGFELEVRSTDLRAEPVPFNVSSQKPKKWYMRDKSLDVSRHYLLALLSPDVIQKHGHGQVRHLQKATYYKELFGAVPARRVGSGKGRAVLMLEDAGTTHDAVQQQQPTEPRRRMRAIENRVPESDEPSGPSASAVPAAIADAPAREGGAGRSRQVHAKSFRWGAAMFTYKEPNAYQVKCPRICSHRHSAGHQTACTKTRSFASGSAESEALVVRELKYWVSQARSFPSRTEHMKNCKFDSPPSDAELEALKIASDYETEDENLRPVVKRRRLKSKQPEAGGAAAAAAAKAPARAKAGVKGKAKAKSRSAGSAAAGAGPRSSSSSSSSSGKSSNSSSSSTSSSSSSSS